MRAAALFLVIPLVVPFSAHAEPQQKSAAVSLLAQLFRDNDRFVHDHDARAFATFQNDQHPRATVVACADSRFQSRDIDAAPEGDLFEIRNIGNQVDATPGSVEYGIRHLHTPVLLIIGHVACGAVKAALTGYGTEGMAVRHELDGLHNSLRTVPDGPLEARWPAGVRQNVYTQVDYAMKEYDAEVKSGALTIIGAVYDFRDELHGGQGKLHLIDVNGERDEKRLAQLPLVKAAQDAAKR